jgi:ABC-type uncharacterized transport system ATPase subunit
VPRRGRLVGDRATNDVGDVERASLMRGIAAAPTTAAVPAGVAVGSDRATVTAVGLDAVEPSGVVTVVATTEAPVLAITGLSASRGGRPVLHDVTLAVRPGEIVGVAGISGNGQADLVDVLCGMTASTAGSVVVAGVDVTHADTATRLAVGLGRLTEDRRGSVVPQMSVEYNLVLEDLPQFTRRGILDKAAIRRHAQELIGRFDIRARPGDAMATLSGGNVQKVLLARALARRPRVLVIAQPTRGLDIGAYRYVHRQLAELRDNGAGVLLVSEDLVELRSLCDRISVLFRGEVVGEVPVGEASGERLGILMTGAAVPA